MTDTTRIPFLAGRLSEAASNFILTALKREGCGELLPCHGDILHVLTRQETATVVELCRLTRRSKSTASALVAKLVDLGYLQRERSTSVRASFICVLRTRAGRSSRSPSASRPNFTTP